VFSRICHQCDQKFQYKKNPQLGGCACPFVDFTMKDPPLLYQEDIDKAQYLMDTAVKGRLEPNLDKMIELVSNLQFFDAPTLKKIFWLPNKHQQTFINSFLRRIPL
jgi:hypothetical protein